MPINPNIALGIQPIQQPNMLGQMAQVMGIRAAQQEMEGNESTRNFFARPEAERGDPSQLLGTKQGQAAYAALNKGQIDRLEAEQKRINLIGAGAGAVLENPTMETFTSVVSNLVNRGIYTPQQRDQAFAAIGNDPSKIKAFVTPIFNQAISAEKKLSDITSRRGQDITAGTTMRGQDMTDARMRGQQAFEREKWQYSIDNPDMIPLAGEKVLPDGTKVPAYFGYDKKTNTMEEVSMPTINVAALTRLDTNAPVNALAPTQPNVNALTAPQAGAPTSPVMRPSVATATSAAVPNAAIPSAASPTSVSGGVRFGPKSTAENLTEAQGKATGFAMRAREASDILDMVGQDGKVQPGLLKRMAEATPLIGEGLGTIANFTQTSAQQQVEQAQRNFVNAVLRQESGAAVNESEFNNAKKQYFPQPGDSKEVIEQKRLNRQTAIQSFEVAAGPGMKKVSSPIKVGTVEEGYKYKGGDPANKNNWEKQ
jgi:hypothetical protein